MAPDEFTVPVEVTGISPDELFGDDHRALDAHIAGDLFGWRDLHQDIDTDHWWGHDPEVISEFTNVWLCPPPYTRDIVLAIRVVERMALDGWEFAAIPPAQEDQGWIARFNRNGRSSFEEILIGHDILPHAICAAARAALTKGLDTAPLA